MCDYSLQNVKSRPAKVGDKLTTRNFGTGTVGFAASEDASVAVCVLPGTELCFAGEVATLPAGLLRWRDRVIDHRAANRRFGPKPVVANSSDHCESYDGVNVKPSSIQPVTPPIIIFTGKPSRARRNAALLAPLQCGPAQ